MKVPKKHYLEEDVLLVHKPVGISSFGLVAQMRKMLGTRKVGHAGTLDPLASGLMIVACNKGTKKIPQYLGLDKTYSVDICLGKSTATGDTEGETVKEKKYGGEYTQGDIEKVFHDLLGEHMFPAPRYSAVKVHGKPLYKYAREGKEPPFIPEKKMHLKKFLIETIFEENFQLIIRAEVEVASGTYVRTLAEELGKKLHYPAHITRLYRKSIGPYKDDDAFRILVDEKK